MTDKIQVRGVGLKQSEWVELEKIAEGLELTPHAVAVYGVRYFLKAYQEGKIRTQAKKTQALPEL
jgi:hypothetical protein